MQAFTAYSVLVTLLTLASETVRASEVDDCPSQRCFCYADEDLECTDLFLNRVPRFIRPPNSKNHTYKEIDLSKNRIKRFGPRSFANLSVRYIKMWENNKRVNVTFHSQSFQGLNSCLEKISLKKNTIPHLSAGLFRNLDRLTMVDLSENKIEDMTRRTFKGAYGILVLNMEQNRLKMLGEFAFSGLKNLKDLNLAHNQLNLIVQKSFHGLKKLEILNLRHNRIRDIQPLTFERLKSLKKLDLSHNSIPAIFPLMFRGLRQLEILILTKNLIHLVAKETFSTMENLKILHLENCKLGYLSAGVFDGLRSLQSLYLNRNHIRSIPARLFHGLDSLTTIQLEYNKLTSLNACSFDRLGWDGGVWLTGNKVHCNCEMAWTTIPGSAKVYGKCHSPPIRAGQEIGREEKYQICRNYGIESCHTKESIRKHYGNRHIISRHVPNYGKHVQRGSLREFPSKNGFQHNDAANLLRYHYTNKI